MRYKAICFDIDGTLYPASLMKRRLMALWARHPAFSVRYNIALKRQLTQMPLKAQVLDSVAQIHGVCIQSDPVSGRALSIERIAE